MSVVGQFRAAHGVAARAVGKVVNIVPGKLAAI